MWPLKEKLKQSTTSLSRPQKFLQCKRWFDDIVQMRRPQGDQKVGRIQSGTPGAFLSQSRDPIFLQSNSSHHEKWDEDVNGVVKEHCSLLYCITTSELAL